MIAIGVEHCLVFVNWFEIAQVSVPIKTLPIIERWDCASCGNCCRGSIIPLSDADLQRLSDQRWDCLLYTSPSPRD